MILKNEFESPCKFENTFHDFISKIQIIFFGVYVLNFIITCAYFYSSWQSQLIKITFDKALTHVFY